jgi:hypothetical protein
LLSSNSDDSTRTQYEAIGQLKVVAPLDYESTSVYTLILFAFDSKNIANISVTVVLIPQNTKAPYFQFTSYQYTVTEEETRPVLDGPNVSCSITRSLKKLFAEKIIYTFSDWRCRCPVLILRILKKFDRAL